jgi:DNA-binding IclR family transcriptional regulator
LFSFAGDFLPKSEMVARILECLSLADESTMSVQSISEALALAPQQVIHLLAPMAKLGFISFVAPRDPTQD